MGLSTENISEVEVVVSGQSFQIEVAQVPFSEGFRLVCRLDDETLSVEDRGLSLESGVSTMKQLIERYMSNFS